MCDVPYPAAAFGVLTMSVAAAGFAVDPAADGGAESIAGETRADEPSSSVKSDGDAAGVGSNDEHPLNTPSMTQIAEKRQYETRIMV